MSIKAPTRVNLSFHLPYQQAKALLGLTIDISKKIMF